MGIWYRLRTIVALWVSPSSVASIQGTSDHRPLPSSVRSDVGPVFAHWGGGRITVLHAACVAALYCLAFVTATSWTQALLSDQRVWWTITCYQVYGVLYVSPILEYNCLDAAGSAMSFGIRRTYGGKLKHKHCPLGTFMINAC